LTTAADQSAAALHRTSILDASTVALLIAGICTFLDVYATQSLLPFLRRYYSASEMEVSLTISATTFAIALAAPFVGAMAEALGRKRVIVPAMFGLSIPTFLAATAPNLKLLIFWRFAQGLFVPGIIAVIMAYIGEEWAPSAVGTAMSAYISGTVLGGFLGRLVPGIVTSHWQWRASFLVLGALNLLGAILVQRLLPRAVHFKRKATRETLGDILSHLRNPRLIAAFNLGFAMLFSLVGTFTYVNFYLAAPPFHLGTAQLGSIFGVYLLGVLITPAAGRFMDRAGFRNTSYLFALMMAAGLLMTLVPSLPVIIIGLAIFSSGVFIAQAAATVQVGRVAGRARSAASGLYVTFYYAGGSLGALVPAWAWRSHAWPGVVVVLLAATVATFVLALVTAKAPKTA
jgi:MFS transporter, YNFM family, putative membrane transport protein